MSEQPDDASNLDAEQNIVDPEVVEAEVDDQIAPIPGEQQPAGADDDRVAAAEALADERTQDLQRLQAEYVNYKRRVDRDRQLSRQAGIDSVIAELLPVLDSIDLARGHDDMNDGFRLVADELGKIAVKHQLAAFGARGDEFDPQIHDALMQMPMDDITVPTVAQVMQTGYRLGDRVLRPARVAVAEPGA